MLYNYINPKLLQLFLKLVVTGNQNWNGSSFGFQISVYCRHSMKCQKCYKYCIIVLIVSAVVHNAINDLSNVFLVSHLDPSFLLSSRRFDFPLPVDAPLILIVFSQWNMSLSLHLVLLVPINSCSLSIISIVYLVLAFCSCIRVAVCAPMFFHVKTNIYTYHNLVWSDTTRATVQHKNIMKLMI